MKTGDPQIFFPQVNMRKAAEAAREGRTYASKCWESTKSAVERSRQQLKRSESIIKWCENFGPRPATQSDSTFR